MTQEFSRAPVSLSNSGPAAEHGAHAETPAQFGWKAWRDVLGRVWTNSGKHNVGFLAAGVAFYAFLSLVPALGLFVMIYGLAADPQTILQHMVGIIRFFPPDGAELINEQLANLIKTANATSGLALVPAGAIALYGASGIASGMISSLNIVYEEEEKRNLFKFTAVSFALVGAVVLVALLGLVSAVALGFLQDLLGNLGPIVAALLKAVTWLISAAFASLAIAAIYRYGPCRKRAKWRWLSFGSVIATALWLLASVLFGWYVSFGGYDKVYGSLGAVVALLMWFFVSAYAVLLGAFVDAEAERQTARDSTTGPDRPIGQRGAAMADTSAAVEEAAKHEET